MSDNIYNNENFCLAISSPSGAGKSTICKEIINKFDNFKMSISATTRPPRLGETNGKEYFFLEKNDFELKIKNQYFIEYAEVFNNLYGTPYNFVNSTLQSGYNVLFDIDYQGVEKIYKYLQNQTNYTNQSTFKFVTIFILPPSVSELKTRLFKRGLDNIEVINNRIQKASFEIMQSKIYNYSVINDNLQDCIQDVFLIIQSEIIKHRKYNLSKIIE